MAGLGDFFVRIMGGTPEPTVTPAPALSAYPSTGDAAFARSVGAGYDSPYAPMIQQGRGRVMSHAGADLGTLDRVFQEVQGAPAQTDSSIADLMMRAYLAANRNPIAALGFDPHAVALDPLTGEATIAGAYDPPTDSIYANTAYPSSIVHESMHRGIQRLRETGAWPETLPEELAVRYMMATDAGDPEAAYAGARGLSQRKEGVQRFSNDPFDRRKLEQAIAAAAQMIARQHPGGPR